MSLDEPLYLLTRLLLRRPGKIHPYSSLSIAYAAELGEEGVKRGMRALSGPLDLPPETTQLETYTSPDPKPSTARKKSPSSNARPKSDMYGDRRSPWSGLSTGLTGAQEKADPQLAEAIRESLWASQVGRVEVDDEGAVVESPPNGRSGSSRSRSERSSSSSSRVNSARFNYDEEFSLSPRSSTPITAFARDETALSLEEIMSTISADDLRKIARARKIPISMLATRDAVVSALKSVAKSQAVLGFTPVKGKRQATIPFPSAKNAITSESLLVAQLLPYLGDGAIQLTPELHALIARVNLIFSRTPPLTSTSSSLMLPSILVTSHKRRYPDYGSPTRSKIWGTREQLLEWERAVGWEALVADALGDTWAEQRKNPLPGFGVRKEMLGRVEGAKVVKRVWEGVWPIWLAMVEGDGGREVDVKREVVFRVQSRHQRAGSAGLMYLGHVLTRIVYKVS